MTAESAPEHKRTFHTLDGLRGIAALVVAFRHIPDNVIGDLTPESFLAVDLFFVLSGFVLAHAYGERLRSGLGPVDFLVQRLIRLYPLYLIGTLITLASIPLLVSSGYAAPPHPTAIIIAGLSFVPNLDVQSHFKVFPLNGPAWSLFLELAINVVYAVVAARLGLRLLGMLIAAGAYMLLFTGLHFGDLSLGWAAQTAWAGIGRVSFSFFAGVAVHRAWACGTWPWLRLPSWAAIAVVLAAFHFTGGTWQRSYDVLVTLLVFPALVLAAARREPGHRLADIFGTLGVASYAIYIVQDPLSHWLQLVTGRADGLGTIVGVAWIALTVGIALLLDKYYDLPVRAFLTRRWRRQIRAGVCQP